MASHSESNALAFARAAALKTQTVTSRPKPHLPISSIPRTPAARLAAPATADSSVLYLAYGSNLCAATFLGVRGIRPLSQVNVSAPSLELVFDLPGTPYAEPCFANTRPRRVPKPPPVPPGLPVPVPDPPPFKPPRPSADADSAGDALGGGDVAPSVPGDPVWNGGLIGVVYEVTPADYAKIIATEGGGQGYQDILVPCITLPDRVSIPEKPSPIPEIPRPFLAHTLYQPTLPKDPSKDPDKDHDDDDGDDGPDLPDDPRKKWYWRFIRFPTRKDGYAQPSARYLNLITTGAAEHALPDDYQAYLASLQPYTPTSRRQRLGQTLVGNVMRAVMMLFFVVGRRFADEEGHLPRWIGICLAVWFSLLWRAYDAVLKPVFGDGERTQPVEEERSRARRRLRKMRRGRGAGSDEEKFALLA